MVQPAKHHVTLTDLEAKVSAFGKHLDAVTTELRDLRHILVEAEIIRPDEPPRSDLGLDAGIDPTPRSPTEFSIGHNVSSEIEGDQVMARAEKAGARITMPARKTFWGGYGGYFQDPDGHLWEVLHNPAFPAG